MEDNSMSEDDFPRPQSKRRRLSDDGQSPPVTSTYIAPSRIHRRYTDVDSSNHIKVQSRSTLTTVPTTEDTFTSLNVAPWLVHSLAAMAIHNPTAIQKSCIPEILKGRDCIGGSRTGTGKTVAFAVPILQKWAEDPVGIYAVILTPTRELALQIYEQFQALGAPHSLKVVLITGGSEMRPQATALSRRPHIVVATPGRLADHILTSGTETTIGLSRTKVVVLDEADRLLAPGTGSMLPDINTCFSALPSSSSRLTLLFTATVTAEVRALKSQSRPPGKPPIFVSEITDDLGPSSTPGLGASSLIPSTLKQTYLQVPLTHKDAYLHILLQTPIISQFLSIIIFTNRTDTADILHRTLLLLDHSVTSLHSSLPQSQRNKNLADFRSQKARILIATDVAGRGLDIPAVSLVINFDVPRNPVDYVHRVGRTARAGRSGTSVTFVGQRDVELILAIESYLGGSGTIRRGNKTQTDASRISNANVDTDPTAGIVSSVNGSKDKNEIEAEEGGEDDNGQAAVDQAFKMVEYEEEGVNIETRVIRGRILKDVGEARMEALRDVEANKDVNGWRRKIRKDKKQKTAVVSV